MPTLAERLDRVPLTRLHVRILILSGLGWMFDALDILIVGEAAPNQVWQNVARFCLELPSSISSSWTTE